LYSWGAVTSEGRPSPDRIGAAVAGIVRYVCAHPDAKDALEGAHTWWLPDGGQDWEPEEVEEAMDWLVARGWMEERRAGDRKVYAPSRERIEEMKRWLNELDGRDGR
jgi:hypothetical protein